jgi:predicted DNA-binding protein (MmcQ/YjbR family)
MSIDELRAICFSFPGVEEDIKWGDHLCFTIGGKMFMITSPDNVPVTASFKVADEVFETLTAREGFIPAPYLARYKWVFVDDISRLSVKDWKKYSREAYDLIFSRLPAKTKKQLAGEKFTKDK